jgi:hypothetical protein
MSSSMHFGKTVPSVRTGIEIHRFLLWKRTDRFLKLGNRNFIRTDRIGLGRTDARPIRNASYPSLDQLVKGICSCYLSEEAQAHELDVAFFWTCSVLNYPNPVRCIQVPQRRKIKGVYVGSACCQNVSFGVWMDRQTQAAPHE